MRISQHGRGFAADALVLDEAHRGYGTSMHYPYCEDGGCTGCIPSQPPLSRVVRVDWAAGEVPEGAALGVTDEQRHNLGKRLADAADRMYGAWPEGAALGVTDEQRQNGSKLMADAADRHRRAMAFHRDYLIGLQVRPPMPFVIVTKT